MADVISLNLTYWHIPLFIFTGFAAGFMDSMAGGGGLITLPVLLGTGLPPAIALGTNKFQASFGSLTSSTRYVRAGVADVKQAIPGIVFTFCFAAMGTYLVQRINPGALSKILPFLLLAMTIYIAVKPELGKIDTHSIIPPKILFCIMGAVIGFYDGFFGPGTGSFWATGLMALGGFNMVKATGYTKIMNFTSNFAALMMFIIGGKVVFFLAAFMAMGQLVGARLGASLVVKKGAKFVRPVFVTVAGILTLNLFIKTFLK